MQLKGPPKSATFTVIGAQGSIGESLVQYLSSLPILVRQFDRLPSNHQSDLGHVIDCAGISSDFVERREQLINTHVCRVDEFIKTQQFESYLYLSSTRIYFSGTSASEDAQIVVQPLLEDHSYNISKLAGEAACLAHKNPRIRIARLSNVVNARRDESSSLLRLLQQARSGKVILHESLQSEKDYISIGDACRYLHGIAQFGRHRIYNVASGINRSNKQILDLFREVCDFEVSVQGENERIHRRIDVSRLSGEFGPILLEPDSMLAEYARAMP